MMKRDLIVLEHGRFELTGYDVWMTAGEIARLFGVTIMKIRGSIRKMERDLKISILNVSRYELLENGYKDDQYNLEAIIAVSYYIEFHNESFMQVVSIRLLPLNHRCFLIS